MSATTDISIRRQVEYPESDGKLLGETDAHRREILAIIAMLEQFFAEHANVYISGNLMLYYEQGNPSAVVSSDVFVVKGVPKHERRTYRLWEEKQPPAVVFEITSRSIRLEDKGNKRALYAMLGVREYFMFDPLEEYLDRADPWHGLAYGWIPRQMTVPGGADPRGLGLAKAARARLTADTAQS